jgi:histidyl-tRNA synthetase
VPSTRLGSLYRSIDKYEKIGPQGVRDEMAKGEIPEPAIDRMLDLIRLPAGDLAAWRNLLTDFPLGVDGIDELEQVLKFTRELGVSDSRVQIDLTMVRGLEYYTGPIFETVVTSPQIGSLTGGGRYDGLIGLFSKNSLPVTGTTVGIERIIDVMDELEMFPPGLGKTVTQVLVTVFDPDRRAASLATVTQLRNAGINAEMWYEPGGLGKQLKYAAAKGIPYAVIIGPDEADAGSVTLRDLASGEQSQVEQSELAHALREKVGNRT